ncbi:MAG: HlyD family efflux transporter periplasmic adaptor subunit [Candidatus Levybacteria bacterium]|nr:HlyD family efflux transporter periplasmic adaptor subunit [Candidatus Levybacteria bacterium]
MKLLVKLLPIKVHNLTKHIGGYRKFWVILLSIGIISLIFFLAWPRKKAVLPIEEAQSVDAITTISANGAITAKRMVNLSFALSGQLVYLGVQKGDTVSAFQTVGVIDQRTLEKNLQTALRNYSLQRNTFEQTQDNYQDRTPEQALSDAMKRILQNNQYDLEKAVLSVELSDLAKQQSVLTTPITGIVTRADVSLAGVYVTPSTIFTIVDPTSLVFSMDVDEADISKMHEGQKVNVVLDAYPDTHLSLTVKTIDFSSHTTATGANAYTVEAELPNNGIKFRLGMSGNAEIPL